jgi:hypothetical protein
LDEAQAIKNAGTLAAHSAWSLVARHRWCLSGTPIQNSVDDLYSYFRYVVAAPAPPFALLRHMQHDSTAVQAVRWTAGHGCLRIAVNNGTKQMAYVHVDVA